MRLIIIAALASVLFLLPHASQAKQLERGEATFSYQGSLLRSDSDFFNDNRSENDFIIGLRQDTIDWGRFEADFITSNIETRWKVGMFRVGVKEFWFNAYANADFEVGDVILDFRTIPSFFTNFILPVAPIRALSTSIQGKRLFAHAFTGWFTKRDGYLGNAFSRENEFMAGVNCGMELPNGTFLGGGFIRTFDEETSTGAPVNSSNNIILVDAGLGLFKDFSVLGEFLYSRYESAAEGKKSGFNLIVGPAYKKTNRFTFKANYRNLGKNFYYLSRSYQTVRNQEGVYLYADFTSPDLIYIYGSGDYYWMQPIAGVSTNLLYNAAGNAGATYFVDRNWYVNWGGNFFKKYTSGATLLNEGLRYELFAGTSGRVLQGKLNIYARMRYRDDMNERPSYTERDADGIFGVRWYLNRRLNMQFETEQEAQWDDRGIKDLMISRFKYYVDWRPRTFIYMTPGIEFTRTTDLAGPEDRNQMTLSMLYGHEFRHGYSILSSVRWNKGWGNFSDSYLDVVVNLKKVFRWGRPHLRIGIPREGVPIVSGTIKGYLFIDENGDRKKQPWEKGLAGVPIILDNAFGINTNMNGEFVMKNVLIGDRKVAIDMMNLPMKYLPEKIKQDVKVRVRSTTEVNFPVKIGQVFDEATENIPASMGAPGIMPPAPSGVRP